MPSNPFKKKDPSLSEAKDHLRQRADRFRGSKSSAAEHLRNLVDKVPSGLRQKISEKLGRKPEPLPLPDPPEQSPNTDQAPQSKKRRFSKEITQLVTFTTTPSHQETYGKSNEGLQVMFELLQSEHLSDSAEGSLIEFLGMDKGAMERVLMAIFNRLNPGESLQFTNPNDEGRSSRNP